MPKRQNESNAQSTAGCSPHSFIVRNLKKWYLDKNGLKNLSFYEELKCEMQDYAIEILETRISDEDNKALPKFFTDFQTEVKSFTANAKAQKHDFQDFLWSSIKFVDDLLENTDFSLSRAQCDGLNNDFLATNINIKVKADKLQFPERIIGNRIDKPSYTRQVDGKDERVTDRHKRILSYCALHVLTRDKDDRVPLKNYISLLNVEELVCSFGDNVYSITESCKSECASRLEKLKTSDISEWTEQLKELYDYVSSNSDQFSLIISDSTQETDNRENLASYSSHIIAYLSDKPNFLLSNPDFLLTSGKENAKLLSLVSNILDIHYGAFDHYLSGADDLDSSTRDMPLLDEPPYEVLRVIIVAEMFSFCRKEKT